MPVIYVKEQRSVIRKRGERIVVEKEKVRLLEIPLRSTDALAVFGNVQVTTQALGELLDHGIPLSIYTRNGRLKGHLSPEASKNVPLRLAQYRAALEATVSLGIARRVVKAKLLNSATTVAGYRAHYGSALLSETIGKLRAAAVQAETAPGLQQLLGCEGAAAAQYFRAFSEMNRSDLPFEGRHKHPAPDPVNALLSLGYTMAMNEVRAATEAAGLEPHLGFLHQIDYGRPSLALDLLEPFRAPLVDRLTLRLINERIFTADDFARRLSGTSAGSVVLVPDSWARYLAEYEHAMTEPRRGAPAGLREAVRIQVESLKAGLRSEREFQPFVEES